jgi:hypothetical protein
MGKKDVSIERALFHELGHFFGSSDFSNGWSNNLQFENSVMTPIDGYVRTTYDVY